jgi:molecular chaperone GrpE (heat shock protein)
MGEHEKKLKALEKARKVRARNIKKAEQEAEKAEQKRLADFRDQLPLLNKQWDSALAEVRKYQDRAKFTEAEDKAFAKLHRIGNEIRSVQRILR